MSVSQWLALLPWLVVAGGTLTITLAIIIRRQHALTAQLTASVLVAALAVIPIANEVIPVRITPLLQVDGWTLLIAGLILATALVVVPLAYLEAYERTDPPDELYLLLLISLLGAISLPASRHFAAFFLSLELLSVPLFALIAFTASRALAIEAGLKYLVLSGVSSATLLFGLALLYADTGALAFSEWSSASRAGLSLYAITGLVLVVTAVAFKLSLIPFHLWTPDIYQGAPASVAGYLATVSKGSVLALLLRLETQTGAFQEPSLTLVLSLMAGASMIGGNLLALFQRNVRRMLAFSSIAHLGYLLVPLLGGPPLGVEALGFYLTTYFVTMIGAFATISLAESTGIEGDLASYQGLFWSRPLLAACFTLMLLSLAGIPLTLGFIGKFYLFAAGVEEGLWALILLLVGGSAIGLFYYLRWILTLYQPAAQASANRDTGEGGGILLAVLTALLVLFGVYPTPLMMLIRATLG